MNNQRLNSIVQQAKQVKARFDLRARKWAAEVCYTDSCIGHDIATKKPIYRKGSEWILEALKAKAVNLSQLPVVTPMEQDWLIRNSPKIARWTRLSGQEGWMDTDPMVEAQKPTIREIWVGARSLRCLTAEDTEPQDLRSWYDKYDEENEENEENDSVEAFEYATEADGLTISQMEQEDAAEMLDLASMLYEDRPAFERWAAKIRAEMRKNGFSHKDTREWVEYCTPKNKYGVPLYAMFEDTDTGEYRPIRNGDMLTTIRGSNDNLDALFMEEGDDPRVQNDVSAGSTDHRWSDRFRANRNFEQEMLNATRDYARGKWQHSYRLPNSNPILKGIRWAPDELTLRRLAQATTERIITRKPELEDERQQLTDQAYDRLSAMTKDLRFDRDGAMVQGYFLSKQEFFGTLEENEREYQAAASQAYDYPVQQTMVEGVKVDKKVRRPRTRPTPVDWSVVRGGKVGAA